MSRKKRSISGFDKVASENDIDINNKDKNDLLHDIIEKKKTKDQTHIFKGFYLEKAIADVIDRLSAGKTKGIKSEIVNEILKKYFRENGLL